MLLDLRNRTKRVNITFVSCNFSNSTYTAIQELGISDMFALVQLHIIFYNFLFFKKQNSNYSFFFFFLSFFLQSLLSIYSSQQIGRVQKNCFSYGCSKTQSLHFEFYVFSKKSVRSHTEWLLQMLGSRVHLNSSEERVQWLFNVRKQSTGSQLFISLWFSTPSCLLIGERQEILVMPFQWLSSFSRGRKILLWISYTHI